MKYLLHTAVVVVCFYDVLVLLLLPSTVSIFTPADGSMAHFVVALACLFIAMHVLALHGYKQANNRWLLLFPIIMIISHYHSPNVLFDTGLMPKEQAIYNYKPMLEALILFLLLISVYSYKEININSLFRVFSITAIVYSVYIVIQHFKADQFYIPGGQEAFHESRQPEAGGFISQPVFAASLIVILLPFVFKLDFIWSALCLTAVFLTGNRSALLAVLFVALYNFRLTRPFAHILAFLYISFLTTMAILHSFMPSLSFFNEERFTVWGKASHDIFVPIFPGVHNSHIITGNGLGSFSVLFPFYNHSAFYQAHNEYLELFFTLGLLGLFVFFNAFLYFIKTGRCSDEVKAAIYVSMLLAFTNPIWHVPQLAFITVLILGLGMYQTRREYDMVKV